MIHHTLVPHFVQRYPGLTIAASMSSIHTGDQMKHEKTVSSKCKVWFTPFATAIVRFSQCGQKRES